MFRHYKGSAEIQRATDQAEDRLRDTLYRFRVPVFIVLVTLLAFWGRLSLWPIVSADYNECLHLWMDEVRSLRGFHSIGTQIGNYTAPYHYLMAAMSYIPGLSNLAVIKITSTMADFCMAAAAAWLCWQLCRSQTKAVLCYAAVLFLPTVFLNSAAWGQCDAMYTTLVLLTAALYVSGKKSVSMLVYGMALAVKLQAIFVLPAAIIFWLCGRLRLRHILCAAVGYVVLFIPAMLGAKSFAPLVLAYGMQTKLNALSSNIYNGASLFAGITADELPWLGNMLMAGTVVAVGIVAFFCWQNRERLTPQTELLLFACMALLVPFLLPAMKDRYYYMAEVLCVVYAFTRPRKAILPLAMQLGSLPAYMSYLFGAANPFGVWLVPLVGLVLLLLLRDLTSSLCQPQKPPPPSLPSQCP